MGSEDDFVIPEALFEGEGIKCILPRGYLQRVPTEIEEVWIDRVKSYLINMNKDTFMQITYHIDLQATE